MTRFIYSLLFYLATPFIVLRLLWRGRKNPDYLKRWDERFGKKNSAIPSQCLWWHTVSVGEFLAALPLIKILQKKYPQTPLLITCMTPTGSAQIKKHLGETVYHQYLPYDLPHLIKNFIKKLQPKQLIIMETELWPNLIHYCAQQSVSVLLINARLSAASANGYKYFLSLTRTMLNGLTAIAAQSSEDAERFISLGFPREHLTITGNIKWDITIADTLLPQAQQMRQQWGTDRPVWIAASTHPGEEASIIQAHQRIRQIFPHSLLLWAPRHPERATQILQACQKAGWQTLTRKNNLAINNTVEVFIIDTLGELLLFYACADMAFVGGSLIAHGGHNLLEPAALAKPIISGPFVFNFTEISQQLVLANALLLVEDAKSLAQTLIHLWQTPEKMVSMANNAHTQVQQNCGAIYKQLALIEKIGKLI